MENKVLIACPSNAIKNYCLDAYVSSVEAMGYDFVIADNTPSQGNKNQYLVRNIESLWSDPKGKSSYQIITDSQNQIRDYFLERDYTHLMFIESDLIAPVYTVEKLLAHQKPVVGFPYLIYSGSHTIAMIQEMSENLASIGKFTNLSLMDSFLAMDGGLKKVRAMGFGCVLIEREIIEAIPFRCNQDDLVKGEAYADSFFYSDLARAGVPCYLDTSITITHLNQDWEKEVEKPNLETI